jgi:hypothetical protein
MLRTSFRWVRAAFATILALLSMMVILPNIMPLEWMGYSSSDPRFIRMKAHGMGGDGWTVAIYSTVAAIILAMILFGQRRAPRLEMTGWILLGAFSYLAFS